MRFVSLFSGVGGFDLGLERAGWQCVAQVEWDKQCQAVLRRHWPDVPKWSDVADVRGDELPPAEVVAFGSPCQDLSVAGKRAGFVEGGRSNLFFEAIRIIKEMRDATGSVHPRFVVWENVVGALSSNQGDDFAAVIDALAEIGAVDIGWRVLDARWFGVPQRRRRIFVVADLAGRCAGAISAEPEGVCWDSASGLPAGTAAATGTRTGVADSGGHDVTSLGFKPMAGANAHSVGAETEMAPTIAAASGGNQVPAVVTAGSAVYGQSGFARYTEGVTPLRATDHKRPEDNIVIGSLQARMAKGANAEGAADGHLVVTHTHTVSSLTQGLGSGGPDAAHALAGWLVGERIDPRPGGTAAEPGEGRATDNGHRRSDMGGEQ